MFDFQTIEQETENIILKEKGSRFIGFAYGVMSEAEIKYKLHQLRKIHPKATHHCYAFRLGINGENYRTNDDGEPSGSAGLPIYNQLLAHQITNVLLVVIRYYGGTKLGVGGLVKAYKETAKNTLENSKIITKELESKIVLRFKFSQQNLIFTVLNKYEAKITSFHANDICTIEADFKTSKKESIADELSEMLLEFNIS
ncbi:MAG: YigZ family protein [Weeksellaceae bacterium]|nr:YigZ family protein [Weeksellaceae bacterium]